jgi:hypothetical protein
MRTPMSATSRRRSAAPRRIVVAAHIGILLVLAACDSSIHDEFPPVGHARVIGQVIPNAEAPSPIRSIFYSCGLNAPGEFGSTMGVPSNGTFSYQIELPPIVTTDQLASPLALRCRFSAPANQSPSAVTYATVHFVARGTAALETSILLTAGDIEQYPEDWDPQ